MTVRRATPAFGRRCFAVVLLLLAAGCGRRGPPQPPERITPEAPTLHPLRQEGERLEVRWSAPARASGGSPGDLGLRKAILEMRVLDLVSLADAAREEARRPPEPEPDPEGGEEEAADAESEPATGADDPPAGEAPADPVPAAEETAAEPLAPPPEPSPDPDPVPQDLPAAPPAPASETPAGAADPDPDPIPGERPAGDPAPEVPSQPPPPRTINMDFEAVEFEVVAELDAEEPGVSVVQEIAVEPDWVGRRVEFRVRYESRAGQTDDSATAALHIAPPIPITTGVAADVTEHAVEIRWEDARLGLDPSFRFADPQFELARRVEGGAPERVGRSIGPALSDPDVPWNREVCYQARLLLVGNEDGWVLEEELPAPADPPADPPEAPPENDPPTASGDALARDDPVTPGETLEPGPHSAVDAVAPEPEESLAPISVRVPGTGAGAAVGPLSEAVCVVPRDTFPPALPQDVRAVWLAEHTEISWSGPSAAGIAGYHVYRLGAEGAPPERLTAEPVTGQVFFDTTREPGRTHEYAVTALDEADPPNESALSAAAAATPRG